MSLFTAAELTEMEHERLVGIAVALDEMVDCLSDALDDIHERGEKARLRLEAICKKHQP